jgi:hypothetical protein
MDRCERLSWAFLFLVAGLGFPAIEVSVFGWQYLLDQLQILAAPGHSLWAGAFVATGARIYALVLSCLLLWKPSHLRLLLTVASAFAATLMVVGLALLPSEAPIQLNLVLCAVGLAATGLRWRKWTRTESEQVVSG